MSWGNKLLFTFILFATGIIFLVYRSMHTNYELVEKEYYKSELGYQQIIDDNAAANRLSASIQIQQEGKGIRFIFPPEMKSGFTSGSAWFYCPYDEKRDRKFRIQSASGEEQFYPASQLVAGDYFVKINWTCNNKSYYTEKKFTIM